SGRSSASGSIRSGTMLSCLFNPGACISSGLTGIADAVLSIFPFGAIGLAFIVGMIVGAILGKVGVGAVLALGLALKLGSLNVAHPDQPTAPTKRALTAEEVKALQAALNARGLNAGPIDGKPGKLTREAIRQYQANLGE